MLAIGSRLRSLLARLPRTESPFWLVLVVALAGGLRLFRIGASSLWFDEAFSWLVARQPAWAILTQRLEPILPPLYHFFLHFWIGLGESEVALRSFSALCGLLTIPVMYALGRELFTPATGLAAALMTAVLPFHVYFARETRLYALVVFLSAALLWSFARSWKGASYRSWFGLGLLAALNLYAHYFAAFTLAVFHVFVLLVRPRDRHRWQGLFLADAVALALIGPHLPAAWAQTRQVAGSFWLSSPSPLELFKTLDYLLFSHTTPLAVVPVALFLTLSIFVFDAWAALRAHGEVRRRALLLLALVLTPILLAMLLSWLIAPVYLDRSFGLVAPAYTLLLGWGLAHPPQGSPVRVLYLGLTVMVAISLGNHYLNPDPAKPPFREVGAVLQEGWQEGDVVFHLHDSSYLPLLYYAPQADSYLLNNDPDTWLPSYTWEWAGRRVASIDEVTVGRSRLWFVAASAKLSGRQIELLRRLDEDFACEREWAFYAVEISLCTLQEGGDR